MAIREVELPTDLERRDNVYRDINEIIDKLNVLPLKTMLSLKVQS